MVSQGKMYAYFVLLRASKQQMSTNKTYSITKPADCLLSKLLPFDSSTLDGTIT